VGENTAQSGRLECAFHNGAWHAWTVDSFFSVGPWIYVVVTYNEASDAKVYKNGVAQTVARSLGTGFPALPLNNADVVVGSNDRSTRSAFWDGLIDEVRVYNRALTPSEIKALYNVGAVKYAPPNNQGLVGYWSFNEGTSTVALDYSGNKNKGTLVNGPAWVNGKRGKALNFDGVNDFVDANPSNGNNLDISGPLTVTAWVKTNSLGTFQTIISKHTGGSNANYLIWIENQNRFQTYASPGGISTNVMGTTVAKKNTWYHVAELWDGAFLRLFVNGVQEGTPASGSGNVGVTIKDVAIGSESYGGSNFFNGLIDEVRVYNRALSADEIQKLYNAGR